MSGLPDDLVIALAAHQDQGSMEEEGQELFIRINTFQKRKRKVSDQSCGPAKVTFPDIPRLSPGIWHKRIYVGRVQVLSKFGVCKLPSSHDAEQGSRFFNTGVLSPPDKICAELSCSFG
ncbi:hypothetical protein HBI04_055220 [Parastagonospora nodorum]|nr:hypothetical protein HBI03_047570 [Parastagonospora nodorum]KAH4280038.1 hypothetical protein HBI04_055220 [Parastagonospora nodorum]KAH5076686.1 hypothetical protein HBH95_117090 [Parastagonospora nodorum]KAH5249023.1 hypothetical protein HBI71_168120 [Parastagonospora nodorum]KAH5311416.1 hypothetical protein HBI50_158510 [Parastagonospora nodorum]